MITMMNEIECYELLELMDEAEATVWAIQCGAQSVSVEPWGVKFHNEDNVIFMIWKR